MMIFAYIYTSITVILLWGGGFMLGAWYGYRTAKRELDREQRP